MIDFWARIDETDVENYAKTLILPEYMSHLKLRPFSFSEQVESASGREPLTLAYVGDGRLEELTLEPERDAAALIASLDLGVDVEKIQIATSGPCWTWNDFGPTHPFFSRPLDEESAEDDAAARRFLRVYFEPREKRFLRELTFDASDAYVSVSRREIFFSWRVLRACLEARCRDLLVADGAPSDAAPRPVEDADADEPLDDVSPSDAVESPDRPRRVDFAWDANFRPFDENYLEPAPADADVNEPTEPAKPYVSKTCDADSTSPRRRVPRKTPKAPSRPPTFEFEVDDQNVRFRFGKLAGSLVAANAETFEDAIRFAGLKRSLTSLSAYVRYDPQNAAPTLDETGVRLRLTLVDGTDAAES